MQKEFEPNQSKHKNEITSSYKLDSNGHRIKKEVVLFVLRQSILELDTSVFELVNRCLFEKYRCDISDCFEHPEYLIDVFRYVFEGSYFGIVESIKKNLDNFSQEDGIKEFLEKIGRG